MVDLGGLVGRVEQRARRTPGLSLAFAVAERAGQDAVGTMAAALTYYAFLSLFPLLLVALSVVGFLLRDPAQQAEWTRRLAGAIPGIESLVAENLRSIVRGRAGAGTLGLLGLLWAAVGAAEVARETLARIFRRPVSSNVFLRKLRAAASLGLVGLLALGSTAATTLLTAAPSGPLRLAGYLGTFAVDTGLFLLLYRSLTPGAGPAYRDLLPAAAVMGAGWTGLKLAGAWYGGRVVARATAVYGTFAAVVGILAILHIATRLFVYGAELAAVLMQRRREGWQAP